MSDNQKTIKSAFSISGVGLHTGNEVTLTFKPAPENHGIKFRRTDLSNDVLVDADVDNVVDTSRGTSLEQNGVRVDTTEHVLAALSGLEIDNILVEMNQSETPILDGSSRFYVEQLLETGIAEQKAPKEYFELKNIVTYTNPERKVEIIAIPSREFRVSVMIDYDLKVLPSQNATLDKIKQFREEIANCRTFVFLHELEYLLNNDLIKGGDLNNAIVFVDRVVSQKELDRLAKVFNKPRIEVLLHEGILNNLELYYPNEPARHKLLDVIGDVALLGQPIKAHIFATRPGHFSNVQFTQLLKKQMKKEKHLEAMPVFDLNKPPLFDINQIQHFLPHRPPFLFIDRVIEMSDEHVVGMKNVTMNESFFVGHFPGAPVMPGVLLIEAMAQTGGILALNSVKDPENYLTYFMKIDKVKFRNMVVPGDTVIFYNKLITPIRRGIVHMTGIAYVGQKIVAEAEMMAQLHKKSETL